MKHIEVDNDQTIKEAKTTLNQIKEDHINRDPINEEDIDWLISIAGFYLEMLEGK